MSKNQNNPDREEEEWEAMMRSIGQAAKILNLEITEEEMPDYMNWFVGREMHRRLWAQVYSKTQRYRSRKI